LGFSVFLLGLLVVSVFGFYVTAPPPAYRLALIGALPLSFLLFLFACFQRSLRLLVVEIAGFAWIALLSPVVYLTGPEPAWDRAFLTYTLFGGYFLLALLYVRARLGWKKGEGTSGKSGSLGKFYSVTGALLVWLIFFLAVYWESGKAVGLLCGPLYAGGRVFAGALWGKRDIPIVKLGVREMIHSLVFMGIVFFTWPLH
jgi:hypothetical protein